MPIRVFHIPACPFSQRVKILLGLKGIEGAVLFEVVDITKPREPALLAKTPGDTTLPILETEDGGILRESLVLMQYIEDRFDERPIAAQDPFARAVENMLTALASDFVNAGYGLVMNQDRAKRDAMTAKLLGHYAELDAFLVRHNPSGTFLGDDFGWCEAVFTPMFMRFWFVEYYEGFALPHETKYARVRRWIDACVAHPAAQQNSKEEIVKLYYDYAQGAGNGALLEGRTRSSFVFEPHWSKRPMPPNAKYGDCATDEQLGLV